ncbi:MFS transporter [Sphaerisporangium aureirubrum]|uniref:MFS transporter n=1 Tax=Sphaerisporangium aureirubrum TaxID=1544736 RepID=A0ABW1NU29_9ACTN
MLVGPLKERNFRFLFISQSVSGLGDAIVPVALAFALLDQTHSAADLGYVLGAQAVAKVVFLLAGGVIADQMSRRAVMLSSDLVRGAAQAALGALLLTGRPSVWIIGLLAFVVGMAGAAFLPASSALVPSIVRPENLQRANHLQQVGGAASRIAGPALAGVLVVMASPGWAILLDAATFGVSAILLAAMRVDAVPPPARRHFFRDLREGWGEFRSQNWLWPMVLSFSLVNLLIGAYNVLGPLASQRYFGGAAAWATVSTVGGVGSVAGGVLAMRLQPRHPLRAGVCAAVMIGFAPLAFAAGFPVPAIAVSAALAGTGVIVFMSHYNSTMQRQVPERSLSRVSSYTWFGALIAFPLGPVIAGPAVSVLSLHTMLLAVGALMILAILPLLSVRSIWSLTDESPTLPTPQMSER